MITPLHVSAIKKFKAGGNASGCFVKFKEVNFFVSVKHSFWNNIPTDEIVTIRVCRGEWFDFTGYLFQHPQADVSVVKIIHEGFQPRHYLEMNEELLEFDENAQFAIVGYDNIVKENCNEIPFFQLISFAEHQTPYEDMYRTLVVPGYSGSPIFYASPQHPDQELVGLVARNVKQQIIISTMPPEREEGDELHGIPGQMIAVTRRAIIETLNQAIGPDA